MAIFQEFDDFVNDCSYSLKTNSNFEKTECWVLDDSFNTFKMDGVSRNHFLVFSYSLVEITF